MKFRLVYKGALPSTQKRVRCNQVDPKATHKHGIRKHFHQQIKSLLESDRIHNSVKNSQPAQLNFSTKYEFIPIVWKNRPPHCSLDILFLRHDIPGSTSYAGDIDNRVKTLLDALRMPQYEQEIGNEAPSESETPFYCLFEDDSLVSHLSVELDQLLESQNNSGVSPNEALIIVTVNIEPGLLTRDGVLIF